MTIEQAKDVIQSSTLPADIKAQALGNLEQHWNELPSYLENAIAAAIDQFDWVKTRQGDDYWDSICKRAERGEFDPPAESESVEEIEKNNRRKLLLDFMAFIGRTYSPTEFWKVGMEDVINEFEKREAIS